ncbi:hypothetical protein D9M68_1003720 [compost metagenome]
MRSGRGKFGLFAPPTAIQKDRLGEAMPRRGPMDNLSFHHRTPNASPQQAFMTWAGQRIGVVKWQRESWIARRDLLRFMVASKHPRS